MKKLLVLSVSVLIFGTGCSMDITMDQLAQNPIVKLLSKSKMTGIAAGSTQVGTATGGYQVQTTVGGYMSDMEQTTSDKSYRVFSSVQGGLVTQ